MQIFRYVFLENVLRSYFSSLSTTYEDWYKSFKNVFYLMFTLAKAQNWNVSLQKP